MAKRAKHILSDLSTFPTHAFFYLFIFLKERPHTNLSMVKLAGIGYFWYERRNIHVFIILIAGDK